MVVMEGEQDDMSTMTPRRIAGLLYCGEFALPCFYGTTLIQQALFRVGLSLRRMTDVSAALRHDTCTYRGLTSKGDVMSIFSNILNKIFHHDSAPANASPAAGQPAAPAAPASSTPAAAPGSAPAQSAPTQAAAPMQEVDVEAVLTKMQASHGEQLNWRTSIVDLMKLLGLDSSLSARKELAAELHYTGNTEDSAAMNIWLHKQVMQKLAENGGKVPDDLK